MTETPDVPPGKKPASRTRRRATVRHSAARLAAVQALYQIEFSGSPVNTVIEEFRLHRLGAADVEVSGGAKANDVLFQELVRGAISRQEEIMFMLAPHLTIAGRSRELPSLCDVFCVLVRLS